VLILIHSVASLLQHQPLPQMPLQHHQPSVPTTTTTMVSTLEEESGVGAIMIIVTVHLQK
jgi:hypothetical protein